MSRYSDDPISWFGTSRLPFAEEVLFGTADMRPVVDTSTSNEVPFDGITFIVVQPDDSVSPPAPSPNLLRSLYSEFDDEDKLLAEAGLSEYAAGLSAIDDE